MTRAKVELFLADTKIPLLAEQGSEKIAGQWWHTVLRILASFPPFRGGGGGSVTRTIDNLSVFGLGGWRAREPNKRTALLASFRQRVCPERY